jgi:glycosyl transferase family 25
MARTPKLCPVIPAVLVLNLARSADRRAFMERQAAELGLTFEFVEGVDALSLQDDGSILSRAEIACLRSHRAIWRRIAEQGRAAIVLEDDVTLSADFIATVEACARDRAPNDLVLLGHHSTRSDHREGAAVSFWRRRLSPVRSLARVVEFPMGAYAALIMPQAAERLVRFAEPPRMPADWVTGYSPRVGVRLLAVTPPCVTLAAIGTETTIDDRAPKSASAALAGSRLKDALGPLWLRARQLGFGPTGYTFKLER